MVVCAGVFNTAKRVLIFADGVLSVEFGAMKVFVRRIRTYQLAHGGEAATKRSIAGSPKRPASGRTRGS